MFFRFEEPSSPGQNFGVCLSLAYCLSTRAKRPKAATGWARWCSHPAR